MKRYILTGTPGSGKTTLLRQLQTAGFSIVEEAATDIIASNHARGIAEPWRDPSFLDQIVTLQRERQRHAAAQSVALQFHDRSVVCTAALAEYLNYPQSPLLQQELERIRARSIFEPRVFFLRNLGFIEPTAARRISFEESLRFEAIHEATYRGHGFELVPIDASPLPDRLAAILRAIQA